MKKILSMFAIVLSLVISGCASMPSPEEMRADTANFTLPKLPQDGKAMVYVVRPAFLGKLIKFNVFVDNKEAQSEMGYTRGKQYIYFSISPGKHKILSKAENWAETDVEANAGDIIFIQQEPEMGLAMARNSIIKIPELEGKYHVKHLKPGTIIRGK